MRATVEVKRGSLTVGTRLSIASRDDKRHTCQLGQLDGPTVEDPGWPVGTAVVVVETSGKLADIERWDAESWRQDEGSPGLKGAVARWVKKHAGGEMQRGASDMTGNIYEGVVVQTESVAAGPNSDKQVSKIVYKHGPFVAKNEQTASGIVLAAAVADAKVDANDVEVLVRQWKS